MKKLSVAITPCPNDVFSFFHLIRGSMAPDGCCLDFTFRDVEALNQAALAGEFDITKLSFHAYLCTKDTYRMLNVGAALGYGCGPLLVAAKSGREMPAATSSVALPGALTTAALLFKLYCPAGCRPVYMRYDRIMDAVSSGETDYGVVIHEGRFVYSERGLVCLQDLGEWWQVQTGLPVPLGCIAARRSLGQDIPAAFEEILKKSIYAARNNVDETVPLLREHAREMDKNVLESHIAAYVNDYSLGMSEDAYRAVSTMEQMARKAGLIK